MEPNVRIKIKQQPPKKPVLLPAMPLQKYRAGKPGNPDIPSDCPAPKRFRHLALLVSFVLCVVAPIGIVGAYLYLVAVDQYASRVAFSVRQEDAGPSVEMMGGLSALATSSSSDTDILYEFIQSQNMVRAINDRLDLAAIYSRPDDVVFGLGDDHRIEALAHYWNRMVRVNYDRAGGLIEVRVAAFDPQDAQNIATAVFEESSRMINAQTGVARDDSIGYARVELDHSVERLKLARNAITSYRLRTQIVDAQADIQGRMGLLNSLQSQLATALIDLDLIQSTAQYSDPRSKRARQRVAVIEARLASERARFSNTGSGKKETYSELIGEYEALVVDQEFAEKTYLAALTAYDVTVAEALRQTRYLAAYIAPSLAETPEYPRRAVLLGLVASFLLVGWAVLAMIYYSLRDRR